MLMKELALLECCAPLLTTPIGPEAAQELSGLLKVLADPARLRILSTIAAHKDHEACVCEFPGPLGLSQPTVSHHLRVLYEAGLVDREKRGTWVWYRARPERLEAMRSTLAAMAPTDAR